MNCFDQGGTYDCGIFSIAFATAVAYGIDPATCFFDQRKMRRHLYYCLSAGKLTPFPVTNLKGKTARKIVCEDIEVHCHCRIPEMKNVAMIECTGCSRWFHVFCVVVDETCLDNSGIEWFCQKCIVV